MTRPGRSAPYLFLAPYFLVTATFFLYPVIYAVLLAFYQTNGPASRVFVGWSNFAFALSDPDFHTAIGAYCLVTFIGWWNAFLGPNIYLQTQAKLPLTVVLNQYVGEYSQQYGVFLAGTLLAILPPAILFFSLQKEFIKGLTSGAVKQ